MRIFIIYILATVALAAGAAQARDVRGESILVIGDSLSAGYGVDLDQTWVALLQDRLTRKGYGYRVVNASISGDTTTGGLRRLPRALTLADPAIVIIELGGNDGLRGTPIHVIHDNLRRMIEKCKAVGARVILAGMLIPPNYGQDYTDNFANVYIALAADKAVTLIPFFLQNVALDPGLMQQDGIHPNAAGQPNLLENVWVALRPNLTRLRKASAADGF